MVQPRTESERGRRTVQEYRQKAFSLSVRAFTPHHAPLRMLMVFLLFIPFLSHFYSPYPILRAGPSNCTRTGRPSVSGTEHPSPPDECARSNFYAGIAASRNCFRSSREANTHHFRIPPMTPPYDMHSQYRPR